MPARQHFPVAPWSRTLKLVSAFATIILMIAGSAVYGKITLITGFPHVLGLGIGLIFPAILIFSLLYMVTGYAVEGNVLHVERLFWSTHVSLEGLSRVWSDPVVCKGSIRIFGNGGLYSFSGLYRNKALGNYRLFATDFTRATVLVLAQRTVVVTPSSPQVFIDFMRRQFPAIETDRERY
ncbi:MAG: hypothetical protein HXX11_19620 [Desulfuromonadales bacterium]|nr:hypothetical protein [Desulfuromonadales bacterium]